jgi:uncharacterized protein (DUF849 family)
MKTSLTIALAVGASAALVHARKAGGTPDAHVALARAAAGERIPVVGNALISASG